MSSSATIGFLPTIFSLEDGPSGPGVPTVPDGIFHGFFYENGVTTDMGTLSPNIPTSVSGSFAINNAGQAIGFSAESGARPGAKPVNPCAFIFARGQMVDLNAPIGAASKTWSLAIAESINDRGQIVGGGYIDGVEQGFSLSPSSE